MDSCVLQAQDVWRERGALARLAMCILMAFASAPKLLKGLALLLLGVLINI